MKLWGKRSTAFDGDAGRPDVGNIDAGRGTATGSDPGGAGRILPARHAAPCSWFSAVPAPDANRSPLVVTACPARTRGLAGRSQGARTVVWCVRRLCRAPAGGGPSARVMKAAERPSR